VVVFVKGIVPEKGREETFALVDKMDAAVAGFVRGRIVIAFIMAVILAIGWLIVGVPYAILLGIGVGVLCAVPFLGLVGIPISVGLLFLDQLGVADADKMAWWGILLWPTLVFGIVQALDGWVLTPLIAGKATNLDPVTIFVAVLAGGSVLGAYGMLLAIPVAACIKILIQDRLLPRIRAWARGEAEDPLPFDD
jgi:predicted PurR-regulated permease PerM